MALLFENERVTRWSSPSFARRGLGRWSLSHLGMQSGGRGTWRERGEEEGEGSGRGGRGGEVGTRRLLQIVGAATSALREAYFVSPFVSGFVWGGGDVEKEAGLPRSGGRTPHCGMGPSPDGDRIWGWFVKAENASSCRDSPRLDTVR